KWAATGGGPTPDTDATGSPTGDGELVVWEGAAGPYFGGTYNVPFPRRADISPFPRPGKFPPPGGPTPYNPPTAPPARNPPTNTSEFQLVVPSDQFNSPFVLRARNTRRLPTDTTATGITGLEVMRPRTIGGNDPYPYGTLYTDAFKAAADVFTSYRWLDVNGALTEREWADRVPPSYGRGVYHSDPTPAVVHKDWVYEYQVMFANETGKDLYLTVPMRASNDYFHNLA